MTRPKFTKVCQAPPQPWGPCKGCPPPPSFAWSRLPQRLGSERPGAPPVKQSLDSCWLNEGHSPPHRERQGPGGSPHPPRPSLGTASSNPRSLTCRGPGGRRAGAERHTRAGCCSERKENKLASPQSSQGPHGLRKQASSSNRRQREQPRPPQGPQARREG